MADKEITGRYSLEINFVGNGIVFLNFWDAVHGNDVVVEVENGALWITREGEEQPRNISFIEYLQLVEESIKKRTV